MVQSPEAPDREAPTMYLLAGAFSPGKSAYAASALPPGLRYIEVERIRREELKDSSPPAEQRAGELAERRRLECLAERQSFILVRNHPPGQHGELQTEGELVRQAKVAGFTVHVHHFLAEEPSALAERRRQLGGRADEEEIERDWVSSVRACLDAVLRSDYARVLDASAPGQPREMYEVVRGAATAAAVQPTFGVVDGYNAALRRATRPLAPGPEEPRLPMYFGELVGENPKSYIMDIGAQAQVLVELQKKDVGEQLRLHDCYAVVYPQLLERTLQERGLAPKQIRRPTGHAEVQPLTVSELWYGRDRAALFRDSPVMLERHPDLATYYEVVKELVKDPQLAEDYMASVVQRRGFGPTVAERRSAKPTMYLLVGAFTPGKHEYREAMMGGTRDLTYIDPARIQAELKDSSPQARTRAIVEMERRRLECLAMGKSFVLVAEPGYQPEAAERRTEGGPLAEPPQGHSPDETEGRLGDLILAENFVLGPTPEDAPRGRGGSEADVRLGDLVLGENFVLGPAPDDAAARADRGREGELVRQAKAAGFAVEVHHFVCATQDVVIQRLREEAAGAPVPLFAVMRELSRSGQACREAILRGDVGFVLDASKPGLPIPSMHVRQGVGTPLREDLPRTMVDLYEAEVLRMRFAAESWRQRLRPSPLHDPPRPAAPRMPIYFGEVVGENRDSYLMEVGLGPGVLVELQKRDVGPLQLHDCYSVEYGELCIEILRADPREVQPALHPSGKAEVVPLTMAEVLDYRDGRRMLLMNPQEALRSYPNVGNARLWLDRLRSELLPEHPAQFALRQEYIASKAQLRAYLPPPPQEPGDRERPPELSDTA